MKRLTALMSLLLLAALLCACGSNAAPETTAPAVSETTAPAVSETTAVTEAPTEASTEASTEAAPALPDGTYTVKFDTDSSMFRIHETLKKKATMTVENGQMTVHITIASQSIVNLYPGLAEDAKKDGAVLLEPTLDTVTYEDGTTEEVHGFDVPVPVLDEEFDLAIIGTKGKWYDHKVSVSNPQPAENP